VPYVSPPTEWMSGHEAIAHIRRADRCSEADAIEQLRAAIVDRVVAARLPDPGSTKDNAPYPPWADKFVGDTSGGRRQIPVPETWSRAEIRSDGTVLFFGRTYLFAVLREHVLRTWPDSTTYRTGAPGRPTSTHLIVEEARRRIRAGPHPATLKAFAQELAAWLSVTHPNAAPTKAKTIQNSIRVLWREKPQN
jgi:hypothetical protein